MSLTDDLTRKLEEAGLHSPTFLALLSPDYVRQRGFSQEETDQILSWAREESDFHFEQAPEFAQRIYETRHLRTGSEALDDLLGGGVPTGQLTEFFGPSGSGKTQVSHQLAVNAQLPEREGGWSAKVVYLDTENSFSPERLRSMGEHFGLGDDVLENVLYAKATDLEEFLTKVENTSSHLQRDETKLLVIDNLIGPFTVAFRRDEIKDRQLTLDRLMWRLREFAELYSISVVFTNRVYSTLDSASPEEVKALGGMVVERSSKHKVFLRKHKERVFKARAVDRQGGDVFFRIDESGVGDV